jgi:biotin carboxyl carrier protein
MTGVIDQVLVAPGDSVAEGARLVVLEAMKMYIDVMAPTAGIVASVAVAAGESVKEGQQLLVVTPHGAG